MSWNEMFDDTSVATASATFSPRHASPSPRHASPSPRHSSPAPRHGSPAPGTSSAASLSPSPSPHHPPRQAAPASHHQQIPDDDILPLPLPQDVQNAQESPGYAEAVVEPQQQLQQQQQQQQQSSSQRPDQHHGKQGKGHRRRLAGGLGSSHVTMDSDYQCVRLAVLGAPGVGKSAIVTQFVMQQFPEEYVPTEQKQVFCPAVIINEHLYEVRIIDCPYIPYFPVSSLYEWTDFRGYGLRNATAYILVYDITSEDSFQYIKNIREQILESRDMHDVPIFVVGNKHDLAEERGMPRREVAQMVKKQWKCGYIECSAKFNWHIMLLFKELMKSIDYIDYGHKPTSVRVQDALRRNRCLIL